MEFSNNLEYITIFDKRTRVETLAARLANLSATQVKEFFANRDIKLPRRINMLALMSILNEKIKTLNSQSMPKDMFVKLQFYKNFNEFQLQSLFEKICDEEDFLNYRINLWTLILRNFECLNLLDGEVQYLSKIKKLKVDDFSSYQRNIFEVCIEINKQFDGLALNKVEEHFNNSFSSDELRRLAEKYGFIISARLKKNEFSDFVKQILKSKRKLTVALGKEIDEMTVVQLNSLCELHEITLSSSLKKNEIIYLLMFLIKAYKLSNSELKTISNENGIVPLEFKVNLDNIDNFGRGAAKEVIILPKVEEPEEEVFEEEKPDKATLQEEMIKEIARKLGLLKDESEVVKEPAESKPAIQQQPKEKAVKQPTEATNGKMTPAERLALARKRKKELAEQRKLEEQGITPEVEEPVIEKQPIVEETKEENEIDVQALISRLKNTKKATSVEFEDEDDEVVESDEPVLEETTEDEELTESDEPVLEETTEDEELTESNEPVLEETTEDEELTESDEPILEETTEDEKLTKSDEPVLEETTEDEELTESDEPVLEDVEHQEETNIADESYDSEFNPNEFINKGSAIENPYYQNKKIALKKKRTARIVLYTIGLIAVFCIGVVAARFLK